MIDVEKIASLSATKEEIAEAEYLADRLNISIWLALYLLYLEDKVEKLTGQLASAQASTDCH